MIDLDTFAARQDAIGVTSQTKSYTVSGSQPALIVFIEVNGSTCSGCTYNGVAMTQVDSINAYSSVTMYSFILINPPTGTHDIIATFNGVCDSAISPESYTGVGTGVSLGGCDSHNAINWSGLGADKSISTTTVANNAWIAICLRANLGTYGAGTNVTVRNSAGGVAVFGDTNGAISPAGATTQTFTKTGGGGPTGAILTVGLAPFTATNNGNFLVFM